MRLCVNCLEETKGGTVDWKGQRVYFNPGTRIGEQSGGDQRDPTYDSITLCFQCQHALRNGYMQTFHLRYRLERRITRAI